MTSKYLLQQTEDAYQWTNKLLISIPYNKWELTPDIIESNVSWQAGHLIMSFYYHAIMVIKGHQMDIIQQVPLKIYDGLFTSAAPINAVGKTSPAQLLSHLALVQKRSIEVIRKLSGQDLKSKLEPTEFQHPVAKTKFEALDWNIKHTMWHCGQIATLKRIVDQRYNFELSKST
jgi:hypothetical protein